MVLVNSNWKPLLPTVTLPSCGGVTVNVVKVRSLPRAVPALLVATTR